MSKRPDERPVDVEGKPISAPTAAGGAEEGASSEDDAESVASA